jgi:hypothetical protein
MIKRLAYTREVLVVLEGKDLDSVRKKVFPEGVEGKNVEGYTKDGHVLLRAITNQFFLEKSAYISKLSRHEEDVDRNVKPLFNYPFEGLCRIPASSTMAVGKRLEDYFAIREEQSLYLTHVWHPYIREPTSPKWFQRVSLDKLERRSLPLMVLEPSPARGQGP